MTINELSLGAIIKESGKYIYPNIAQKGIKYVCPECTKDLLLCKGNIKLPYFRHYADSQCTYYSKPTESQIHKDAKMLLQKLLEDKVHLYINRHKTCCNKHNNTFKVPVLKSDYSIVLEHRFNFNGVKIADVAYIDNKTNTIKYIFEIFTSHRTNTLARPGLWFEFNANDLLEKVKKRNNKKSILELECIRLECNDCYKKKIEKEKERLEELRRLDDAKIKRKQYYKKLLQTTIKTNKLKYMNIYHNCCSKYDKVWIPKYLDTYKLEIDYIYNTGEISKQVDLAYLDNNNTILCLFDIRDESHNLKFLPEPYFIIKEDNIYYCSRRDRNKCATCIEIEQEKAAKIQRKYDAIQMLKQFIETNTPITILRHLTCCNETKQIQIPTYQSDYKVIINSEFDLVYINNVNKSKLATFEINYSFELLYYINDANTVNYKIIVDDLINTNENIILKCRNNLLSKCDVCKEKDRQNIRKKLECIEQSKRLEIDNRNAEIKNRIKIIETNIERKRKNIINLIQFVLKKNGTIILSSLFNCCGSRSDISIRHKLQMSNITIKDDIIECCDKDNSTIYFKFNINKDSKYSDDVCKIFDYKNNGNILKLFTKTNKKCNACSLKMSS